MTVEVQDKTAVLSPENLYAQAENAFSREDWPDAVTKFHAASMTSQPITPAQRLMVEIAKIRIADSDEAIRNLDAALIREASGTAVVRVHLVKPLHRSRRFASTALVLEKLLEAYPDLVDAHRLLASLLARQQRWMEAIAHMDMGAAAAPDDLSLQGARVQYRLLARQLDDAAKLALELKPRVPPKSRESHILLMALLRGGRAVEAGEIAQMLDPKDLPPHVTAFATEALVAAGMTGKAVAMGEAGLAVGHDSGVLRAHIGEAILIGGKPHEIATQGVEHLQAGVEMAPEHGRINALLGEALLRSGRHLEAIAPLEKAMASEMKSPKTRSLYARALRYCGRFEDSADQYIELLRHTPGRWPAHRQAIGALCQAGRVDEASSIFKSMISTRSAMLAPSFEDALASLNNKLETAPISQTCLDWAWNLRRGQDHVDRSDWERRARWGLLADLLIIDWLECREEQAEEAMALMTDLSDADRVFEPLRGKGFLIATAHVGPLFSGPILLELCGLPSRWVASTPSIADAHYAASVISTTHQTESQVARACFKALQAGYAVAIAVDGSSKMGSPTVPFEGQFINYSPFAAQIAHKLQLPSLFYAPSWKGGRLAYDFKPLPIPAIGEEFRPFAARWRDAYLGFLRDHLGGAPENLRFGGGLWSCIRPLHN